MTIKLRRLIYVASVVILALCLPRMAVASDQLVWKVKGTIEAITSDSLSIKGFSYTLTSATAYEKNDHQTTRSAFAVGDYVQVSFLSDSSVLKVEGTSEAHITPTPIPTPVATPKVTRFNARLKPLGSSTAKGESVASYSEKESKFTVNVRIPHNSIPFATTESEAKVLVVKAAIMRDGDLVATCTAAFEPKKAQSAVFKFKTEIEKKSSARARSRKGRCVLAKGRTGLPTVRVGDLVTVSEATAGEFLKGYF